MALHWLGQPLQHTGSARFCDWFVAAAEVLSPSVERGGMLTGADGAELPQQPALLLIPR